MESSKPLKTSHKILACIAVFALCPALHAEDAVTVPPSQVEVPPPANPEVQPFTKDEMMQGIASMRERQNQRIEAWGSTLKPEDFERSWFGRILKKPKRQEVCGLYQDTVNETIKLALQNKERLPEADQKLLQDRNAFIQSLGYKNNLVDTQMGFNCRLK